MAHMKDVRGVYRHYKGNEYEVIGVGYHTETEERLVVYRSTKEPEKLWARPYAMFFDVIRIDGVARVRFEPIDDEALHA